MKHPEKNKFLLLEKAQMKEIKYHEEAIIGSRSVAKPKASIA
jgi:hypothetical protein